MPIELFARVFTEVFEPSISDRLGEELRLAVGNAPFPPTQACPFRLQLGKEFGVLPFRFLGIMGAEAFRDDLTTGLGRNIDRHPLSQPVDSGLRMPVGTAHRKHHVHHPCVSLG